MDARLRSLVADAVAEIGSAGETVAGAMPGRFALFHGANSICSQKVRTVFAHHAIGYESHALKIFRGETYLPGHVRLRMIGCDALGGPLHAFHDGSTSATTGGCDGAVVPTLVDHATDEVLVDSKRICLFLDGLMPEGRRLRPAALGAAIDAEIDIVDNLPNYQMLVGRPPGEDRRPNAKPGGTGAEFSIGKVARCNAYLAEHADDPVLVRAYAAKRAKEHDAAQRLFTPEAMEAAYALARAACVGLEGKLAAREAAWLLGPSFGMADLYWAVELLRMKNLGAAVMWEGGVLPGVTAYVETVEALPAIRSAVLEWPGAMY